MKIWLIITIILTVLLALALRWAKTHNSDGDMGGALLTLGFFFGMLLNWAMLIFSMVYRWLNGGGA
ncbi:MAG TPA: hypothetical protein VN667_20090 [Burkholderiales bacterium]|nr:hypothetical protein [Burkholderiales bacterium]